TQSMQLEAGCQRLLERSHHDGMLTTAHRPEYLCYQTNVTANQPGREWEPPPNSRRRPPWPARSTTAILFGLGLRVNVSTLKPTFGAAGPPPDQLGALPPLSTWAVI